MSHPHHEHHVTDYLRIFYKRRWTALTALLVVFLTGAINSLRTTPIYEASAPLLIEQQARKVTSLDTALSQKDYQDYDFLPTELRILQSRALAKRTVQALGIQATPAALSAWAARQHRIGHRGRPRDGLAGDQIGDRRAAAHRAAAGERNDGRGRGHQRVSRRADRSRRCATPASSTWPIARRIRSSPPGP